MAQQHNNVWIQANSKKISALKRQLIEYSYSGSYGGSLPLMELNNTIDGALLEIMKLQKEVDTLKAHIASLPKLEKEESATKDENAK